MWRPTSGGKTKELYSTKAMRENKVCSVTYVYIVQLNLMFIAHHNDGRRHHGRLLRGSTASTKLLFNVTYA